MLNNAKHIFCGTLAMIFIMIAGCAGAPAKRAESSFIPKRHHRLEDNRLYASLPAAEGSLWTDASELLFVDRRAGRTGDTVTVDIIENTSSSMDVNTETSKNSEIEAGIPNFYGYMTALQAKNKYLNKDKMIEAKLANKFKGEGTSDRSGQVTASIGARVTEVLPNGNLAIYGRRDMTVNNERQYITVSGIIRPDDIGPDNRIKSIYLADACIEYSGKGVLADKQKPGWMTRIVDNVWPF